MAVIYAAPGGSSHHSSGGIGAIGRFFENLGKDIGDAAKGTPKGIEDLVTHPIRSVEGIGKTTWQTWSPLFEGHIGEFAHDFYDHPLAPMLDIATVFTGGAAVAARLGKLGLDTGLVTEASALGKLAKMPTKIVVKPHAEDVAMTKYLPRNPIYNAAYRKALKVADTSPAVPSWFKEHVFSTPKVHQRLQAVDFAHAVMATNGQIAAIMKMGETFNKAGHKDWPVLEHQLFSRNYWGMREHAPEVPLEQIKLHGKPKGYTYVQELTPENVNSLFFQHDPATDFEQFRSHLSTLGNRFTTPKLSQAAMVNKNGKIMVKLARKHREEARFLDGSRSASFAHKLYKAPTQIWKAILLGYSPRVVINNSVGNWLMYAMRQGGHHSIQGFVDAVRFTRGEKAALKMLKETGKLPEQSLMKRYFGDELGNTFGTATLGSDALEKGQLGRDPVSKLYKHSFYPLVHTLADVPVRVASITAFLRGDTRIQQLMGKGMTFEKAAEAVLKKDPELRDRAALHARTVAGDYATMTGTEQVIRDFMPFYLWDKHIVRHTLNMLHDRPAVVAAGAGVGAEGAARTRTELGDIPSFMVGMIELGKAGGRKALLSTQGLNPYATVPDIVDFAQGLITGGGTEPGEAVAGELNPVLEGAIAHISGVNPSGAPVTNHGGIIPSILVDTANSLTPVQLARQLVGIEAPQGSTPRLYKKDLATLLSSLAGIPVKKADLDHAHQLAYEERHHGKKPKKSPGGITYAAGN